eukprot:11228323-Lingulodinium_polyedra.AAC.1
MAVMGGLREPPIGQPLRRRTTVSPMQNSESLEANSRTCSNSAKGMILHLLPTFSFLETRNPADFFDLCTAKLFARCIRAIRDNIRLALLIPRTVDAALKNWLTSHLIALTWLHFFSHMDTPSHILPALPMPPRGTAPPAPALLDSRVSKSSTRILASTPVAP